MDETQDIDPDEMVTCPCCDGKGFHGHTTRWHCPLCVDALRFQRSLGNVPNRFAEAWHMQRRKRE